MAKRNKKIKNQLLQSIKNNKLIDNNLQVQNSEQNNTDISESTDSFFHRSRCEPFACPSGNCLGMWWIIA